MSNEKTLYAERETSLSYMDVACACCIKSRFSRECSDRDLCIRELAEWGKQAGFRH